MPRQSEGPRLWFKRGNIGADGKRRLGTWTIKDDGGVRISTGVRAANGRKAPPEAHDALARYILERRKAPREKRRTADAIKVADVISIYMQDVVPAHVEPNSTLGRCEKLIKFWGERKLSEVSGRTCREYVTHRGKPVARRELEDLKAAINYHRAEGYCREVVEVTLPQAGEARDRWLTRSEAARLIWAAWRFRDNRPQATGRQASRQHIARFALVALYTGTRAGAVCAASFQPSRTNAWIDLNASLFYRRGSQERETKKRRPSVKLPERLVGHMRRWQKRGQEHPVEFRGKPIKLIWRGFTRAAESADLPGVSPHTLRHTAATWLMQAGTDVWQAAGYLGMTVETLTRVYGHHHPDYQQEAVDNIVRKPTAPRKQVGVPVHKTVHDGKWR